LFDDAAWQLRVSSTRKQTAGECIDDARTKEKKIEGDENGTHTERTHTENGTHMDARN
jgi:hypothetical protein